MRRFAALLAIIGLAGAAYAQAVTMTGVVVTPGGSLVQLQPTVQFMQSCNAGAGGIVGQGSCTSGGGGGAVTAAAGSYVDGFSPNIGTLTDPVYAGTGNKTLTGLLAGIWTRQGTAPMQSTGGTVGLVAGSAIVGKFGIDQTTPGTTNATAPKLLTAAATQVQSCGSTDGVQCSPQAGVSNRTITHTNLTLNTNATICPAATNPVTTEIYFTTAGVGVNLQGGTLVQATVGASTTTTPQFVSTAGMLYTFPVGPTNIITAYGAAGYVVCIQTLRQ